MKRLFIFTAFIFLAVAGYSQAKTFKWVPWKDVSAKAKADLQKIKGFNSVMQDMKSGCDVNIATVDLDNNGIKGYAVSEEGGACCGSLGCTFMVFEGKKTIYLTDQIESIKPARNGVISSTGKFIPLK